MNEMVKISYQALKPASGGTVVIFVDSALRLGATALLMDEGVRSVLKRASNFARFKGKKETSLDLLAPADGKFDRLLVVGIGAEGEMSQQDWLKIGGIVSGKLGPPDGGEVTILCETSAGAMAPAVAADIMLGLRLRTYRFDRYKSPKTGDEAENPVPRRVLAAVKDVASARKEHVLRTAIGDGVELARDLVNLPANDLGPLEFVKYCENLRAVGVKVEVLTEKEMSKLGMRALLGVGQGSRRGSRLVVMRWEGTKATGKPLAFVGKGVVFDSGGISIKPAQNMEDMKGDMAGAACVTGLMRTLAQRKAKVNAIGIVGLVENMPDGNAQRPGDVVRAMSGQTIEIINTDAEGRLVLADALWYCQQRFKPRFMVNLATLTGAVLVALGQEHAGLFSNDDALSEQLLAAGRVTDEKLWRLPLSPAYDKIIDSKIADVKNSGGRYAGAITAAQFLQRFVNKTPWAHLDIAGTGMGVSASEINHSWGPGFGVRLLERFVADQFEKGSA